MHNASRASVSVWVLVVVAAESMMFVNNDSKKKTKKETQKEKGSENLHVVVTRRRVPRPEHHDATVCACAGGSQYIYKRYSQ